MSRLSSALAGLCLAVLACGNAVLSDPVVANTGKARSTDGFEAALATAEAEAYSIIVNDREHDYLRLAAKTKTEQGKNDACYFEIKAWSGSVDIYAIAPAGRSLTDSQAKQLRREGMQLAWAISTRARLLAGEPLGTTAEPPSNITFGLPNYLPPR